MTKKDLIEKCRKILYSNIISDENHNFLMSILELHTDYSIKIGIGVKNFFIQDNIYNKKGFRILRIDETTTDFSFYKCIYNPSKEQLINRACRDAVNDYINTFRTKENTHIHHDNISFNKIVLQWLKKKDLDLRTNDSIDNCQRTYFLNNETIKSFIEFHSLKANLVELTVEQHKAEHYKNKKIYK